MTGPATIIANDAALTPLSFLRRSAGVFPDKTAVVYGERRLSYAGFRDEVERLARAVRRRIRPGDRVAFLAPNVPELLFAHFAVPLAGGVLVAINSRLSAPEVAAILDHSGARLLFVDAAHLADVAEVCSAARGLDAVVEVPDPEFGASRSDARVGQIALADLLAEADGEDAPLRWEVDDERSVISINYTSGTTGKPKGVMYTHRGAYLNSMGEIFHNGFTRDSVYLWTLPMFHCNGWCTPWAVTAAASTHVLLRAVRGDAIWHAVDGLGVTHLCGAPTVCSLIADAPQAHVLDRPLRITTAGAPPSPQVIQRLEGLGVTVVHVYGLTEVYGPFTICEHQPEWDGLPASERAVRLARQGVAMIQAEPVRVVDGAMADVPADGETIGEVVLRGNNVMLGYFEDPEATAEAFRGGWFHSGDLAVMHPDGYIEIRDRAKDIIISGGENISTIEVENALTSHPAVLDAAVVGVPDEKWGERPVAFVLLREGRAPSAEEIRAHARGRLAGYKIPDRVEFVASLPRTATGKIQKHRLRGAVPLPAAQEA